MKCFWCKKSKVWHANSWDESRNYDIKRQNYDYVIFMRCKVEILLEPLLWWFSSISYMNNDKDKLLIDLIKNTNYSISEALLYSYCANYDLLSSTRSSAAVRRWNSSGCVYVCERSRLRLTAENTCLSVISPSLCFSQTHTPIPLCLAGPSRSCRSRSPSARWRTSLPAGSGEFA